MKSIRTILAGTLLLTVSINGANTNTKIGLSTIKKEMSKPPKKEINPKPLWETFFKQYVIKTTIGGLTGAACGASCAYFERRFFNNRPNIFQFFCSWSIFCLIKSGLIEGISQEMGANGIPCYDLEENSILQKIDASSNEKIKVSSLF